MAGRTKLNKVLPTPDLHVLELRFKGFTGRTQQAAWQMALAAKMLGIKKSGPISLPRQRSITVIPGAPFKHRKSMETYMRDTYTHVLYVEASQEMCHKFLHFIHDTVDPIAGLSYKQHRYYTLDKFYNFGNPVNTEDIDGEGERKEQG
eukprot:TRINITY_DN1491_c0_g1_i1.p1 TRINITY_DN1491_c0_g1~~TRINITY_DN1491_c0_g1_i1.p1  ORF type:complete len:148 (-),score=23.70 TRINITY_DN1491_c0_g1_i1:64-507(-)